MKRRDVKAMLTKWEQEDPGRTDRLFRALQNVTASHLADRTLYDFEGLGAADGGGLRASSPRAGWQPVHRSRADTASSSMPFAQRE